MIDIVIQINPLLSILANELRFEVWTLMWTELDVIVTYDSFYFVLWTSELEVTLDCQFQVNLNVNWVIWRWPMNYDIVTYE